MLIIIPFFLDEAKESIVQPQLGMPCVTKFNGDGLWYRGKIVRVMDSFVDVFFVDNGNVQQTPIPLVKIIDQEFIELPPQAYKCSLDIDISDWARQEIERFKECTMGKIFSAKFASPCNSLNLKVELTKSTGESINKSFEAGLYQQVTNKKRNFCLSTCSIFLKKIGIW